jgi:hypothetical protein
MVVIFYGSQTSISFDLSIAAHTSVSMKEASRNESEGGEYRN